MELDEMPYRSLGRSDLRVSAIGLGSWLTFGSTVRDTTLIHRIYSRAYDAGIRYFDTADSYAGGEAERRMGLALKDFPRQSLVLSSKAFFPTSDDPKDRGLSRRHIMESVERSLQHLKTDYLDLFFCHRFDQETPLEETLQALDDLVQQGKVRCWGTSEWRSDQIRKMARLARRTSSSLPRAEQPELNLFNRTKFEHDTRPAAQSYGMGLVTFSPLASGRLTGKYDEGIPPDSRLGTVKESWLSFTDAQRAKSVLFKRLADEAGCTRAQLAISWCLAQSGVSSVITGASRLEQLEDNLGALRVQMTNELSRKLDQLFAPGIRRIARFYAGRCYLRLRDRFLE